MGYHHIQMSAGQALERLKRGNQAYIHAEASSGNVSLVKRNETYQNGQHPYAVIVTCSDARVIPEYIFSADIGDLFVIRVGGNVIDNHQLGSIAYAVDTLLAPLVVVLGHTCCGAVDAAMHGNPEGYLRFITDEIKLAIGTEIDPYQASCRNVRRSVSLIQSRLQPDGGAQGQTFGVVGGIYAVEDGRVSFLTDDI